MTEEHHFKCATVDFLDLLHFLDSKTKATKVVSDVEFHFALDPQKVGDHLSYGSPKARTIIFHESDTLSYMLA